jgi:hypothetical protein
MKSFWLAFLTPWLALGCLSEQVARPMDSMQLLADDEAMTQEVLRYITPGMSVNKAKSIMEQNDFTCAHCNYRPGERPCLKCKATIAQTSAWHTLLTGAGAATVVEVRLFYEGGAITDIQVKHYMDGP